MGVTNVARPKKIGLVVLGALAIVLGFSAPSQAAGGRDFGGGRGGQHGFDGHHFEGHGFEGHHFEGHDFEGRHFDEHRFEGRDRFGFGFGFGVGPVFPYYPPYYEAPSYWYFCPSYNAYYPSVPNCPEAWVPVPSQ
jgi:hypothetical protein